MNQYLFANLGEAREIVENWRQEYNKYRPHSSLDYLTPAEFAIQHQAESARHVMVVESVKEPVLSLQVVQKAGHSFLPEWAPRLLCM